MNDLKSEMAEAKNKLIEAHKAIETICSQLATLINALPDNPKINRISDNAYTISSSDLGTKNWSPSYNDFKSQYERIAEDVKRSSDPFNQLATIITVGKVKDHRTTPKKFVTLHPDVIEHLKGIID